jgi:hypothetical protein
VTQLVLFDVTTNQIPKTVKTPNKTKKKTKNNPRDFLIEIRGELVRKFQREIFVDSIHK